MDLVPAALGAGSSRGESLKGARPDATASQRDGPLPLFARPPAGHRAVSGDHPGFMLGIYNRSRVMVKRPPLDLGRRSTPMVIFMLRHRTLIPVTEHRVRAGDGKADRFKATVTANRAET